ncbi:MAG: conjugative transposon protein TraM [Chitinophagaceae bacterium]|nr:MAG: conjugative transposon protein TraM [Chitinophagaceae bacterium]
MKNSNPLDARKRKALLLLPLLIIPFLTMAFWALGGGKGSSDNTEKAATGLNLTLPPAQLKDDGNENKMSFYDAAQRSGAGTGSGDTTMLPSLHPATDTARKVAADYPFSSPPATGARSPYRDPNEEKIYRKLDELNQQLATATPRRTAPAEMPAAGKKGISADQEGLEQMEAMIRSQNGSGSEPDPELESLNGMMDKILDIQHPERVRERQKLAAGKATEGSLPVATGHQEAYVSLLGRDAEVPSSNGFYSLEADNSDSRDEGTIEAVVHGTQSLTSGSVAKLRLLQDLVVGGRTIPTGSFVFGTINLNGERAEMTISSIQYRGSLFPVQLEVYDIDGMPGLHIPGAITRDAAKTSADGAVQTLDISMLDPSLKAQAASAGINTVKNVLGKKAKLVRVTLKSGYKVFLKNKKQ